MTGSTMECPLPQSGERNELLIARGFFRVAWPLMSHLTGERLRATEGLCADTFALASDKIRKENSKTFIMMPFVGKLLKSVWSVEYFSSNAFNVMMMMIMMMTLTNLCW